MIGFTGRTSVGVVSPELEDDEEFWFDEMHAMTIEDPNNLYSFYLTSADLSIRNQPGDVRIRQIPGQAIETVYLQLYNGHIINCGPDQEFLSVQNTYIKAKDITAGYVLAGYRELAPQAVKIAGIERHKRQQTLYIPEAVNDSRAFLLEAGVYAALFKKD